MGSDERKAWIRYDISTGDLLEVTFQSNGVDHDTDGLIEISTDKALDFLEGVSRMMDYLVILDDNNDLILSKKGDADYTRSFWELCNAESDASPIQVLSKSLDGFSMRKPPRNKVFVIYVTEKNDPNKLLMTLRSSQLKAGSDNEITYACEMTTDYSIYVRNHVT